jgi:hypothetical protein
MIDLGTWQHALGKAMRDFHSKEAKSLSPANDATIENVGEIGGLEAR